MVSHIFVVSPENLEICKKFNVCGLPEYTKKGKRLSEKAIEGIKADLALIRRGDLVFFYVTGGSKKGGSRIHGYYEVCEYHGKADVFYDRTILWTQTEEASKEVYPFRVKIKPVIEFSKPIEIADIWDLKDKGIIWSIPKPMADYGPGFKRSLCPITIDETKELIRLFLINNPEKADSLEKQEYRPNREEVRLNWSRKRNELKYEETLQAWLLKNIEKPLVKDVFGESEEFISWVPTSYGSVMDIFLIHKKVARPFQESILSGYTVVECKKGVAKSEDVHQLMRYMEWVSMKKAGGYHRMVNGVIVAADFQRDLRRLLPKLLGIGDRIRLAKYQAGEQEQLGLTKITHSRANLHSFF